MLARFRMYGRDVLLEEGLGLGEPAEIYECCSEYVPGRRCKRVVRTEDPLPHRQCLSSELFRFLETSHLQKGVRGVVRDGERIRMLWPQAAAGQLHRIQVHGNRLVGLPVLPQGLRQAGECPQPGGVLRATGPLEHGQQVPQHTDGFGGVAGSAEGNAQVQLGAERFAALRPKREAAALVFLPEERERPFVISLDGLHDCQRVRRRENGRVVLLQDAVPLLQGLASHLSRLRVAARRYS